MAQQRYDVWFQPADKSLPALSTLFIGLTKYEAKGFIAAKDHMYYMQENAPTYFAVKMKDKPFHENKVDLNDGVAPASKHKFEVCQSWDEYPFLWTVCFLTNYISTAKAFIYSLNAFYDRDRHFCLRERGSDKMIDFLPRDHRKVGVC